MSIKRACKAANVLDDRLDTQLAWSGEPAVGQPDVHFPFSLPAGVPRPVTSGRSFGHLRPVKWWPPAGVGQIVANSGRSGCRYQSSGRSTTRPGLPSGPS